MWIAEINAKETETNIIIYNLKNKIVEKIYLLKIELINWFFVIIK